MPKRVDHQERRERIAAALQRVAADRGLEAVSLRHVATEAGVTAGMVQHYFPTKEAMLDFAMASASARFEARMSAGAAALGDDPSPRDLIGAMLKALLPLDAAQRADGRVALAFLSYAATRRATADDLGENTADLRGFLAEQIRRAQAAGEARQGIDADDAATGLFAMTEGLAVHLLSAGLPTGAAVRAFEAQLDLVCGPRQN